jgi:membrane fusion protein, multidrug efflux system
MKVSARVASVIILLCTGMLTSCDSITGGGDKAGKSEKSEKSDKSAANSGKKAGDKKGKDGPAIPVIVAAVSEQSMPLKIQAIGNVEVQTTVALKSRLDGQIVNVGFRDGQDVAKGQVLFEIDARPLQAQLAQAQATLARDKAQLDRARQQEERYKDLLQKGFVSQDAYAQFRTNVDTAAATVRAAEAAADNARIQSEYAVIRSPIEGRAGKILIQQGNLVKANDTPALVVINQLAPIYVSFAVPEQYLGVIRKYMALGKLAVEAFPPGATEGAGVVAAGTSGTLAFVDNTVDASTGTVRLRATFPNKDKSLWPGQFVTASVTLNETQNAIVVPSQAVQTGPKGQFVYVVKDGVALMREITVERADGPLTVVAKGLAGGEQVVTSGQSRLVPGMKVSIRPEAKKS